jgi:drug/metabolite transporter (DMT)-like permease
VASWVGGPHIDGAMRNNPYIGLTVTLFLWASSFPAIKSGLDGFSPLELAAVRFLMASAVLACVAPVFGVRVPRRSDVKLILALGLAGIAAYHILLNYGEMISTSGAAAFITNIAPVFSTVLAGVLGERVRGRAWAGVFVSLGGAWLISLSLQGPFTLDLGCLLFVVAALCWSLFFVLQKPLLAYYSPLEVTCYAIWTAALWFAMFLPGAVISARSASLTATISAVYLGVLPLACGYLCWSYVLSKMPVSQAAIYTYFVPIISAVMGYAWLGERPGALFMLGAGAVLFGVALAHPSEAPLSGEASSSRA